MNSTWKQHAKLPLYSLVATLCVCLATIIVFALQNIGVFGSNWGIIPRSFDMWRGFVMSPLMHGSWGHLIGNLSALIVLIPLCGILYPKETLKALPIIWVSAFAFVWLFGAPNSSHIGASGLIYGLMSFSIFLALFHRSWKALLGCAIVAVMFSGALWGLLPKEGVSFTAHAGGALGGVLAAYVLRKPWRKSSL